MSMSVATKYAAYFTPVVGNMITAEVLVKGLATTFHEKVKQVMIEVFEGREFDGKEASGLYMSICNEVEHEMIKEVEKYYPVGTSLSEAVKNWRQYKSVYKNGMLMGINPAEYDTYSKYKAAKLAPDTGGGSADNKDSSGGGASGTDKPTDERGGTGDTNTASVSHLKEVENALGAKVSERLALALEVLSKLDDDTACEVLANMEGICRQKLRANPRMVAL